MLSIDGTTGSRMSPPQKFVVVAGATGNLGSLIALSLRKSEVAVKAIVRPGTAASRTRTLRQAGVVIEEVDLLNIPALTKSLAGGSTVVSALQGLRDVMLGTQGALLDAAVAADVQRFIPSDFSLDFTKTTPGSNRNLDLRREFHAKLYASGIQWTSIQCGGFMEMLTSGQMPMINDRWHCIHYFGSADQKLDFTTVPEVAAYTAAVAADPRPTPTILRIAGDSFSATDLAAVATRLRGQRYKTMWIGSLGFLRGLISILKFLIRGVEDKLLPAWQGMQYLENMVSGEGTLDPLDNDRYPDLTWTTVEKALREVDAEKDKQK
ncbi:hypothetical protein LTR35_005637 [Friedmanniomyces endolithicus]|nr:hypothetical protein LTR35_005637 [Friedmanniomyces endolithicus]KAK0297665.1 hypothetical protein LTS00_003798 [Friedmanniomyces endolithicus]KAK0828440.1 hypothetical protein LTR73_004749 [Friedmanniomyces endolithicus]KAK1009070.1 hypothetical protein LTR54_005871 [Friedmanniomyces endolithicus]